MYVVDNLTQSFIMQMIARTVCLVAVEQSHTGWFSVPSLDT